MTTKEKLIPISEVKKMIDNLEEITMKHKKRCFINKGNMLNKYKGWCIECEGRDFLLDVVIPKFKQKLDAWAKEKTGEEK